VASGEVTNVGQVIRAFEKTREGHAVNMQSGLFLCAQVVLRKALKLCPIDTGALRDTGTAHVTGRGFGARAVVEFGGPDAPYALYVHENLDAYHEPPTQAKFLEAAARLTRGTCASIMQRRMGGETVLVRDDEVVQ
jgi:hypothetical protein